MGEKTKAEQEDKSELYVIGVGASAGGLDALSKFLKSFNDAKSNMCVVIVMHLSKDHKSELAPILDKRCKWDVVVAENTMQLKNEHVYVCPKNKQISIKDNTLVFEALSSDLPFTPSIDNFFTSLARAKSKKAIGVILSGFGDDGSKGIKDIGENGGFTIAQLPETAEHREMPKAAIDTGKVDLILPAAQMYDDIVQYTDNIYAIASSGKMMDTIDIIFELLEKRSGTDFSIYKPTTIMRRINHRIASLQLDNISEYYELIKKNPQELDKLFDSVLIGVTEFFRNLEAFEKLKKQLRKLIENKEKGDSIRVWSVGCATGEEAYSVAIMLYELLGDKVGDYNLQVFASDIDERAINFGRKGTYHKKLLGNVPDQIINKYFDKSNDVHHVVKKEIRQHVLFARHDITTDPPFVNLDLVICRNLLIYFNKDLQKQSLQVFHYSLKREGLLFLGKSESVTIAADLFSKKGKGKIYQKAEASLSYQLKFSRLKNRNQKFKKEGHNNNNNNNGNRNMSIVDVAKETLYHKYDEPFVIINENSEIKEVHGSLRLYLEISEGTMNINLHKMLNLELVSPIKALLAQVKKTNVSHTSDIIKFKLYGQMHYVRVKIMPLMYRVSDVQYYMIIFEAVEQSAKQLELQKKLETSDFENLRIKELEDELSDFIHSDDKEKLIKAIKKALKTGSINEEVCLSIKTDKKWIQLFGTIIYNNNSEPQSAIISILDITQDKVFLQKLTESEERFKTIANVTPTTVWITDKDGNCTYINNYWLEFTGSTLKVNLGKGWMQFIHKKDRAKVEKTYLESHKKETAFQIEYRARQHDGTYFWFLNRGIPTVDNDGNFNGYMGSFANINEQMEFRDKLEKEVEKQTKDIRKANAELMKLNLNLEEFAYMASHDLKEPLRKIRTFSSLITSEANDKATIGKYVPKIQQSAERMTDLIEHILEYSRIKRDGIKSEEVNLDAVYKDVISDLTLLIQERNVQMSCEELGYIKGMPVRIYQLFSNLVRNAIKFNDYNPKIEITVKEVEGRKIKKHLNANTKINFKSIKIEDNGIGFNEEKKEYIFKPFKRLNALSEYPGTGIGLAICKRIMDIHNGCIDVESEVGKGSSFILYFPIHN